MISLNSESRNLKALKKLPLVQSIDEHRWEQLTAHISFTELDEGDNLFIAGKPSEKLYMVMEGEIALYLDSSQSSEQLYLNSRKKADTVGDFAVLNGGAHLVSAFATRKTRLACFPRLAFDLLTNIDPSILAHVYATAAELSRRVMLARVYRDLFGDVTTNTMNALLDKTSTHHYTSGDILIREGEKADGLHIVVSGRLHVESSDDEGNRHFMAEVYAPETVGELALLSDSERGATVYATRESTVAYLDKEDFDQLIAQKPNMLMALSKLMIQRHAEKTKQIKQVVIDKSIAIIPLDKTLPLRRFLRQLKAELRKMGHPLLLDSRGFDTVYGKSGASMTEFSDVFNSTVAEWLDDKESSFQEVFYITDLHWNAWTKRCINRVDRVILLADADDHNSSELRDIEIELNHALSKDRFKRKIDLVLLHASTTEKPNNTIKWLRKRNLDAFHHVRIDDQKHMARLARRLCGCARGIVFSGGGARGYAHLGVQRVIEEYDIDIDYIGGASMGGLLGASMALGQNTDSIYRLSKVFANKRALFDYTLPLVSLLKSAKLTRFCQSIYGNERIEDCWIPYFCVSANLADGCEVIHDRGQIWRVVRSTISLPGIFTPVPTPTGQLLVDGAVLNTFPVDVMHEKLGDGGSIIGVNVSQIPEIRAYYQFDTALSGWKVLLSRVNPFVKRIRIPRLVETLLRSTDIKSITRLNETKALLDILIEPAVNEIALMDFKSYAHISDIGYKEACKVLRLHGLILESQVEGTLAEETANTSNQLYSLQQL